MGYSGTSVSIQVERPLTDWEYEDLKMCLDNIMNKRSFFYAGSDDVADEVVRFVAEYQLLTNLEEVVED